MEKMGDLARAAQQGNLEAFATLVKQFQDMAFTVAYVQLGDESLAEDAAQEGFIEAYLHIESLREPAAFAGWLRRIVLRRCNRMVRRRQPQLLPLEQASDIPAHDPGPVDMLIGREAGEVLHRAIQSLPEHERAAILLHYISGYSQNEIAAFLEVPAATLRKRLQSARERLKERIMTMGEEYFERRPSKGEAFGKRVRFFIAVRTGNEEEVHRLLAANPELAVVRERWSETLAQLYPRAQPTEDDRNALKDREQDGWSPLQWAVWGGWTGIARALIDYGASPEGADWRGTSLLAVAARGGSLETAALLLDNGADPNGGDAASTPLHAAVATAREEMIALLLARGADIERRDQFGRTPLHWGATVGHKEAVILLMKHGASTDAVDDRGYTALWWARHGGHTHVVDALEQSDIVASGRDLHQEERRSS